MAPAKQLLAACTVAMIVALVGCTESVEQADLPDLLAQPHKERHYELNQVSLEELLSAAKEIDGLTVAVAESIINFRSDLRFRRVQDLLAVPGIGEKTYLKIRKYFYVKR